MAVDAEMIKRIMGAPDSPTGKLVALRKTPGDGPLEVGVWYSNFTRVRKEAAERGIPFFAMWTNGDLCGFCRRFTSNILEPAFMDWMKSSGGLWWLGGSMDDNEEDRREGIGFKWCIGPDGDVNYFPFFAVVHVKESRLIHGFFGSGHDYDQRKAAPEGAPLVIAKISDIMRGPYVSRKKNDAVSGETAVTSNTKTAAPVRINPTYHIRFNPDWDADHIARFQNALKENGGHCCCQKDKTPDTMCMCKKFLEQNRHGFCECGAFEKFIV